MTEPADVCPTDLEDWPQEHSAYWLCRSVEAWIARWDALYAALQELEYADAITDAKTGLDF